MKVCQFNSDTELKFHYFCLSLVPDEFVYDFQRRRHIDMSTRPELIHSSIEYVASVEYMVRPPQPATYLFVFECTGPPIKRLYIKRFAETLCSALDSIPGDSRTLIGFIAFDSRLHFFNLNQDKPVHLIEPDIDGRLTSVGSLF